MMVMANGPDDDDDEGFPTSAEISRMEPPPRAERPLSTSLWPVAVAAVGVVLVAAIIVIYYFAR